MYVRANEAAALAEPLTGAIDRTGVAAAAEKAASLIPPAWPLAATVAVNPFLGQTGEPLERVASRLARITCAPMTMPRQWYRDKIAAARITDADLAAALSESRAAAKPSNLDTLKNAVAHDPIRPASLPTLADLAAQTSAVDWPAIVSERFSAWAAGYFDEGQALWAGARNLPAFAAWRAYATHDLTPEIAGLKAFANFVDTMPITAVDAIMACSHQLRLTPAALESYFHQLLLGLGGWSQYARYKAWRAEQQGSTDGTLVDLLAIRLVWEAAFLARYRPTIAEPWAETVGAHAAPHEDLWDLTIDSVLQRAYERALQRELALTLQAPIAPALKLRPKLQAAFCIDVRSEIIRRHLESVAPETQTLGFAGFFGLPISHLREASDTEELRLPVLLTPGQFTCAAERSADAQQTKRFKARAKRAWRRFKLAAVSSFAFVEAAGPLYIVGLIRDALALPTSPPGADSPPTFRGAVERETRAEMAANILRAMSLTKDFSRLVVLVGHGARVVNNPHASALHCGACGGYTGEVNARLLARLLNSPEVRQDLEARDIVIPADTLFLGALHHTTTDEIRVYVEDCKSPSHEPDIKEALRRFEAAGALTRQERALRMGPRTSSSEIIRRSRDWAEVRPEWALAGCHTFIAAPRAFTSGKALGGRAFLHDYDWRADANFSVLELILTAPVVVASWINLQYYGSTVAPEIFGSGNKLLHNVVGGIGVLEGNGGVMRSGLPWQSVHDGQNYVHEPARLTVCLAAPAHAVTGILTKHPAVKALFDNQWLSLCLLDDNGRMSSRYRGGGWETIEA